MLKHLKFSEINILNDFMRILAKINHHFSDISIKLYIRKRKQMPESKKQSEYFVIKKVYMSIQK